MTIKNQAFNQKLSLIRKKTASPMKFFITGIIALLYAITGTISTLRAQDTGQCTAETFLQEPLRQESRGFFKALRIANKPIYMGNLEFEDDSGKTTTLATFQGKTLLVNLWAIWCKPCRDEIPEMAELKRKLGGDYFDILAINLDRNQDKKVINFLERSNAENLLLYRNRNMKIFEDVRQKGLGVGLPVTLLISPRSCLLASLNGSAPWANREALALIRETLETEEKYHGRQNAQSLYER